jgi:tRNA(Ile2) C34 agmatinyltransferase TiaS
VTRQRVRDVVLGVRHQTWVHETTWTRIRCGRCGHEQETTGPRTSTCKRCGRTMRLDSAVEPGSNIVPIRRRPA